MPHLVSHGYRVTVVDTAESGVEDFYGHRGWHTSCCS
ncbi:MAG: hypothetical protein AAF564_21120 [Bacteroidota bacterium]